MCDIEGLNHKALEGELEVTAVSVHSFPYLHDKYVILTCAASMGGVDYGPRLVANTSIDLNDGIERKIAHPGKYTSASLALQIFLHESGIRAELVPVHFDEVQAAVKSGEVVIFKIKQTTHMGKLFR